MANVMEDHFRNFITKDCDFCLISSFSLSLLWAAHSGEASCYAVSCPHGQVPAARN